MYIDGKIVQVCRRARARRLGDSSTGTAARAAELLTTGDREDYYRKLALYILHLQLQSYSFVMHFSFNIQLILPQSSKLAIS